MSRMLSGCMAVPGMDFNGPCRRVQVSAIFALGVALTGLVGAIVVSGRARDRTLDTEWRASARSRGVDGFLCRAALLSLLCSIAFPQRIGQSWSQFKLVDWAHPFAMAFALLAVVQLRRGIGKCFDSVVTMVFVVGLVGATLFGVARVAPLIQYYGEHAGSESLLSGVPPNGTRQLSAQCLLYILH